MTLDFIFFDLMSQAFGALAIGLVISLLLWGGVFFCAAAAGKPRRPGVLSVVVLAAAAIYIMYHVVPLCGAVAAKSRLSDFDNLLTTTIVPAIEAAHPDALVSEDIAPLLDAIEEQMPLVAAYLPKLQIAQGQASTLADVALAVTGSIHSQLSSYIWGKVAWTIGGCVVWIVLTVVTLEKPRRRSRTHTYIDEYGQVY